MYHCGIVLTLTAAVMSSAAGEITFVAVGDWGDATPRGRERQRHVADVMDQWCSERNCDFILGVGDAPTPGKSKAQKDRFTRAWRNLYGGRSIRNLRWYTSLGGHSEAQHVQQLQFAATEPRWYLPWYYYSFEMKDRETGAVFYAMDSQSLRQNVRDPERQLTEMQQALSRESHWKIVFGRHSPLSAGQSAGDETVFEQVVPVCEQHGVDLIITGHERSLQHLTGTFNPGVNFVVSGGGGRTVAEYDMNNEEIIKDLGYSPHFFDSTYGFVGITLSSRSMTVEFYDYKVQGTRTNKRLLHTFTKHRH